MTAKPFRPAGRVRSTAYGLLWRSGQLLHRAGSACGYIAAGILCREDLRAARRIQFQDFGASADDVDEGLSPFEERAYTRGLPASGRVLLVGCGAGRDLIGLHRLGFDVEGLDQAPDLVERARQHLVRVGITATVRVGDIETADIARCYDAIVFGGTCYSHVNPSTSRVAALARLRPHLSPGGRLLIGYNQFLFQSAVAVALMRCGTRLTSADWQPEPGDFFRHDTTAPGVLDFIHYFSPGDVARECLAAGFRVVGEESSGMTRCAIARVDGEQGREQPSVLS